MSVAISISPELMIVTKASEAGMYSYRLDSGQEDLNRAIASDDLKTLNFLNIPITGFNKFLYFDSLVALDAFIAKTKQGLDAIDSTPYEDPKIGPDVITAVSGSVGITFSNPEDKEITLCNPIYRVYPDKNGNLMPIQDVRQYISKTWTEECKEALFHTGTNSANRFGVIKTLRQSEKLQLTLLKSFFAISLLIIVIIASRGLFANSFNGTTASLNSNSPAGAVQQQNTLLTANESHPAAAVYGGGFSGQEGHNSVADFSRLQVEQTESMLKDMGVDIEASKNQNLGCFARR